VNDSGAVRHERGGKGKPRDYAVAAVAAREALARARDARRANDITEYDFRVLVALVELVPLYSRTTDYVGLRQVERKLYDDEPDPKTIGYRRDRITASLRRLHDAAVIEVETTRGRNARTSITFPQSSAHAPDAEANTSATAPDCVPESSADGDEIQRETSRNPARRVGHSGKYQGPGKYQDPGKSARALADESERVDDIEDATVLDDESPESVALVPTDVAEGELVDGDRLRERFHEHFRESMGAKYDRREVDGALNRARARDASDTLIAMVLPETAWPSDMDKAFPMKPPGIAKSARAIHIDRGDYEGTGR
jgi:hypothetical protein